MNAVITTENTTSTGRPVQLPESAVDRSRAAAVEEAGDEAAVGSFVGSVAIDDVAAIASFAAELPGYRGWRWAVTVAQVADGPLTISEVVLLPGSDALLAPEWVPWDQRVRPDDLGPGDLLPTPADDERLVPGYVQSEDPAVEELALELGLGRVRVMGREGRDAIAEAWHDGPFGPDSEMARQAPGQCISCAFYLPLAGSLGGMFGACGNEFAPAAGRVVDLGYGCGAHSEAAAATVHPAEVPDAVIDALQLDVHLRPGGSGSTGSAGSASAESSAGDVTGLAAAALAVITDLDPLVRAIAASPQPLALAAVPVVAALGPGTTGSADDQVSDRG
jgi:hypothetical protein